MWYSIVGYDVPNSLAKRKVVREQHLARLRQLSSEDRLLVCGPNPAIDAEDPGEAGFSGSLIIAKFDSLVDAQNWADAEPYLHGGVYDHVEVKPFKPVTL